MAQALAVGLAVGLAFGLAVAALPARAGGTLADTRFESATLHRNWHYLVYLPENYAEPAASAARFPVLYLLHGHGGNRNNWVNDGDIVATADRLIAAGDMPPCLIVMPDAGTSWYVDAAEPVETAFINDLLPDVERRWRGRSDRAGRLIGGLSMGGYGALRFSMRYPERFGAAALFAPAAYDPLPPTNSSSRKPGPFGAAEFDPEVWRAHNWPALWAGYQRAAQPVPMFIMSGDKDEYFIEGDAARLYERLRHAGQPAELRIVAGGHNWQAWKQPLDEALRTVFRWVAPVAPAQASAAADASVPASTAAAGNTTTK